MSIKVRFYNDVNKKWNSTQQPALTNTFTEYDCVLKEGFTITQPEIEIYISGNPEAYNYAYIPAFERYYFIKDWTYFHGTWTASMQVDVLASYKTQIGNLYKYVTRSASSYDLDVKDVLYPSKSNVTQTIVAGNNPFTLLTDVNNVLQPSGCFILGLVGNKPSVNVPSAGGVNYYLMTSAQMTAFIDYLMGDTFAQIIEDSSTGMTDAVVKAIFNPIEYISSCMYMPFRITGINELVQPQLGWWVTSPLPTACNALGSGNLTALIKSPTTTLSTFTVGHHPQYARGHYLDLEPYSRYTFYLEPWGAIPLDSALVSAYNTISMDINVDLVSGVGRLTLLGSSSHVISTQFAQIGVPIQISQILSDVVSGFTNVMSALTGAITQASFGNVAGTIAASANGIVSTAESLVPQLTSTGANGTFLSYAGTETADHWNTNGCYLKIERYNLVDEDLSFKGRPLCQNKTISSLTGYIQCADGEHVIAALEDEKAMISDFLTGGFFYE